MMCDATITELEIVVLNDKNKSIPHIGVSTAKSQSAAYCEVIR
jgi:hypothetical protein